MLIADSILYRSVFPVLFLLIFSCNKGDNSDVALVNNYPISINELQYWMLLHRAEVHNYYYKEYGIIDSDHFWEEKIDGNSPIEMLKELAFQQAVRAKIQQILANEKNIVDQIDFEHLISEMHEENQRRKESIEKGDVVYGAKKYTERTFIAHKFDNMLFALKAELLTSELKPSEKDLEKLVRINDLSLEDNYGFYQMQFVEENYDYFIDSLVASAEIEMNKKNWNAVHAFFK